MSGDIGTVLRESAPPPRDDVAMSEIRARSRHLALMRHVWIGSVTAVSVIGLSFAAVALLRNGSRSDEQQPLVSTPATIVFDSKGDAVTPLDGWIRTTEPLTPLVDPREILTLSTEPPAAGEQEGVCVGDAPPAKALATMGSRDALIWIVEWNPHAPLGAETSTPRPTHFTRDQFVSRDCVNEAFPQLVGRDLVYTEQGRIIDISVVTGRDLRPDLENQVYETLDSLTFRPA
jgi:hypothetical protein